MARVSKRGNDENCLAIMPAGRNQIAYVQAAKRRGLSVLGVDRCASAAALSLCDAVRIADPLGSGKALCSGRFDRLVIASIADRPVWARVLDYKTDAIEPSNEESMVEMIEQYRPQMDAYRRSAGAMLGLETSSVEVALVLTSPGQVVEIPSSDGAPGEADG